MLERGECEDEQQLVCGVPAGGQCVGPLGTRCTDLRVTHEGGSQRERYWAGARICTDLRVTHEGGVRQHWRGFPSDTVTECACIWQVCQTLASSGRLLHLSRSCRRVALLTRLIESVHRDRRVTVGPYLCVCFGPTRARPGYGLLVLHGRAIACVPRCRPGPMLPLFGAVA